MARQYQRGWQLWDRVELIRSFVVAYSYSCCCSSGTNRFLADLVKPKHCEFYILGAGLIRPVGLEHPLFRSKRLYRLCASRALVRRGRPKNVGPTLVHCCSNNSKRKLGIMEALMVCVCELLATPSETEARDSGGGGWGVVAHGK